MTLWLNDVQKQSLTFIDSDGRALTEVRLGAQGIETGTSGTLYFDDFESRRFSYIGTLTDPGVDDPTATNQPSWFARTYAYSASAPHAVTSVSPDSIPFGETGSPDTYEYDANGNMTCRIENDVVYTHTYNAENRASSIAKRDTDCTGTIIESWSFAYDGDGVRVSTAHFTGTSGTPDSTTSYFMGGQFEVKDGATKKYYSIAGMMVAMNDGTGLQYLLTDHLGSTVAVTNASGTLTSQQRYLPFGAARTIPNSPILGTDFTYTGQRKLDDGMGGIMDYKARFYSVGLGRFVQPDSIIPNPANPQTWNRFSYVYNRPIILNDPTGHDGRLPPCLICNITWFNYTKLTVTINSDPNPSRAGDKLMDIAFSVGCMFVGCHVDTKKNEVKGPTTGEWAENGIFALATPLHMPSPSLYAVGNTLGPRPPRIEGYNLKPGQDPDIYLDPDGLVIPGQGGASTYETIEQLGNQVEGHVWELPGNSPDSLFDDVIDGVPFGSQPPGHHSLVPNTSVSPDVLIDSFNRLPWRPVIGPNNKHVKLLRPE